MHANRPFLPDTSSVTPKHLIDLRLSDLSTMPPIHPIIYRVIFLVAGLATISLQPPSIWSKQADCDSTPFVAGEDGYACYRCPTLAVARDGTLLAFCEGRVNSHKDEDDIDVVLKRSSDGGRTWGPLQVLANDGRNPCKNACPVVLPSGRIVLVWLWNQWIPSEKERTTRKVFVLESDDAGSQWSEPREITESVYQPDWRWYGTGPCHGIVKQFEPHRGRVVIAARHSATGQPVAAHFIYSDDGGKRWNIGGTVPHPKSSEATVVERSDGALMIHCRNQEDSQSHRVVAISFDGGETFAESYLERQLVEPRGCQGSLLFHSIDPQTGKGRILFSNPSNASTRSDGTLKLSCDDGKSWTLAYRYAPKPAPYFTGYSDLAVLPDGRIGILCERGDLEEGSRKADRYDEVAFTAVKLDQIQQPLP
jgi:sialidase-1